MNRVFSTLVILIFFNISFLHAQEKEKKAQKVKQGWTFGAVPAIAYDSDIGFRYGGLVNFYDYGDGSTYPKYRHSLYLEWSRTTKGSGTNQFTYDSEYLIPGVRTSAEVSYLTEQALDFYGFNGYNAYYNSAFEDDQSPLYKSRMFYRMDRKLLRIRADFQGKIGDSHFRWLAGFAHYGIKADTVDIERLNKGKTAEDCLPSIGGGLYGDFVRWGLIPEGQVHGGNTELLKLGIVFDTRDNEPNPMTGIWTEAQLLLAPRFLGNGNLSYSRIAITHRQYFTILPEVMNFAYRLSYQAKLGGTMPFYM
ncbi:MAG TPA: BamA/TamA family outer membrane protein, partial [Bacteroidales bacterium]|nr:BamA/TamA family outer membrane protein [Bacteroidales bacterium]